jgi:hypothetical protein
MCAVCVVATGQFVEAAISAGGKDKREQSRISSIVFVEISLLRSSIV